jgi:hypothetical protein
MVKELATNLGTRGRATFAMLRDSLTIVIPAIDDGKFDDLVGRFDSRSDTASQL